MPIWDLIGGGGTGEIAWIKVPAIPIESSEGGQQEVQILIDEF